MDPASFSATTPARSAQQVIRVIEAGFWAPVLATRSGRSPLPNLSVPTGINRGLVERFLRSRDVPTVLPRDPLLTGLMKSRIEERSRHQGKILSLPPPAPLARPPKKASFSRSFRALHPLGSDLGEDSLDLPLRPRRPSPASPRRESRDTSRVSQSAGY